MKVLAHKSVPPKFSSIQQDHQQLTNQVGQNFKGKSKTPLSFEKIQVGAKLSLEGPQIVFRHLGLLSDRALTPMEVRHKEFEVIYSQSWVLCEMSAGHQEVQTTRLQKALYATKSLLHTPMQILNLTKLQSLKDRLNHAGIALLEPPCSIEQFFTTKVILQTMFAVAMKKRIVENKETEALCFFKQVAETNLEDKVEFMRGVLIQTSLPVV